MIRRLLMRSVRRRHRREALVRVLMVCRVNHCRSPMAEGMLGRLLEEAGLASQVFVDSAGTHSQMKGMAPDPRGQKLMAARGINISGIKARRIGRQDLDEFDYVLAMDRNVYEDLLALCENDAQRGRVHLLMQFAPAGYLAERASIIDDDPESVPDPYYGGAAGFGKVVGMMEQAVEGLLRHLREHHSL